MLTDEQMRTAQLAANARATATQMGAIHRQHRHADLVSHVLEERDRQLDDARQDGEARHQQILSRPFGNETLGETHE